MSELNKKGLAVDCDLNRGLQDNIHSDRKVRLNNDYTDP